MKLVEKKKKLVPTDDLNDFLGKSSDKKLVAAWTVNSVFDLLDMAGWKFAEDYITTVNGKDVRVSIVKPGGKLSSKYAIEVAEYGYYQSVPGIPSGSVWVGRDKIAWIMEIGPSDTGAYTKQITTMDELQSRIKTINSIVSGKPDSELFGNLTEEIVYAMLIDKGFKKGHVSTSDEYKFIYYYHPSSSNHRVVVQSKDNAVYKLELVDGPIVISSVSLVTEHNLKKWLDDIGKTYIFYDESKSSVLGISEVEKLLKSKGWIASKVSGETPEGYYEVTYSNPPVGSEADVVVSVSGNTVSNIGTKKVGVDYSSPSKLTISDIGTWLEELAYEQEGGSGEKKIESLEESAIYEKKKLVPTDDLNDFLGKSGGSSQPKKKSYALKMDVISAGEFLKLKYTWPGDLSLEGVDMNSSELFIVWWPSAPSINYKSIQMMLSQLKTLENYKTVKVVGVSDDPSADWHILDEAVKLGYIYSWETMAGTDPKIKEMFGK